MYFRLLSSVTISLTQQFSKCGLWSPTSFQGFDEIKTIKLRYRWLSFCVDMCTDGTKAMMGKTAGPQNKSAAPNYTNSHCNFHHYTISVKKKVPIPLNILNEVVKKGYLSPYAHLFLIFCVIK